MKMSKVFDKDELNFNGYFALALDRTEKAIPSARHAVKFHDELVEALELALHGGEFLTATETEEIEELLVRARG